ncbi:MAG: RNA-guided endonuclease InsQ/TnpB family protein [Candidatus Hodarchaeales archaeon]
MYTIQCPITYDKNLLETINVYNSVVQEIIDIGWNTRTFNKNILHCKTYKDMRRKYPSLQSSLVQCARDMAADMLKVGKFRYKKPTKKLSSGIRFNQRTFTPFVKSGMISISTINGRQRFPLKIPKYFQKYMEYGRITSLTLYFHKKKKKFIAYLVIELPDVPVDEPSTFLGIDRGIKRIAVCSNNTFYNTNHILAVKWKYQQFKKSLQSKGTSGRERRFMTDENRKLAKWICNQPYSCFILENMRGIKKKGRKLKKASKKLRRKFSNWSYYQLEQFIIQRAETLGKTVLFVNPKYTSQRCSHCGYISRGNRSSQSLFKCQECYFQLNADLNAARNLSDFGMSEIGRASVTSPNVAVLSMSVSISSLPRASVLATSP